MDETSHNKHIAKNTLLLYTRMIVITIINLYAVRVVLNALGAEDYGIFNVIAGVVTTLSFVSSVLATATQRFYSTAIGQNNPQQMQQIFSTCMLIYLCFALLIVLLGETLGLWFVNTHLNIPDHKMATANRLYQFSILTFILTILQNPYTATIIAHEDMRYFAIISTIDCLLKFAAALLLLLFAQSRLSLYGMELVIIAALIFAAYIIICHKHYPECHFHKVSNPQLRNDMLRFSGWTAFGAFSGVCVIQINTILTNIFFGPVVNAARAIALQINTALMSLTGNFTLALRPPMISAYAEQNTNYLNNLFHISNKVIYYGMIMLSIPLILEMEPILQLWLKTYDSDMVLFSQMIVIYSVLMSIHNPITTIVQATGQLKAYYLIVEGLLLLCMPLTYLSFALGRPASDAILWMIITILLAHIARVILLKKTFPPFSIRTYLTGFILPATLITAIAVPACYYTSLLLHLPNLLHILIVSVLSVILVGLLAFGFGFSTSERNILTQLFIHKQPS